MRSLFTHCIKNAIFDVIFVVATKKKICIHTFKTLRRTAEKKQTKWYRITNLVSMIPQQSFQRFKHDLGTLYSENMSSP